MTVDEALKRADVLQVERLLQTLSPRERVRAVLQHLERAGLLNDRDEIMSELREKVLALPAITAKPGGEFGPRAEWASPGCGYALVDSVLALLAGTRARTYSFGDFVTNETTGATGLFLRLNGVGDACVSTDGFYDVWQIRIVRPATEDERARTRGGA